ncbi:unnamed protein product [Leuciscus chuanchicus]
MRIMPAVLSCQLANESPPLTNGVSEPTDTHPDDHLHTQPSPLRPYCDLRPDKDRWKRDCQTGRGRVGASMRTQLRYCPGGANERPSHIGRKAESQSDGPPSPSPETPGATV